MSYRIQVHPEAGSLLQTLAPPVLLRLGRALAELAEALASGEDAGTSEVRVDDCVMRLVVDHAHRLLEVICIEHRDPVAPAWAGAL
jgi:hypothetical protein